MSSPAPAARGHAALVRVRVGVVVVIGLAAAVIAGLVFDRIQWVLLAVPIIVGAAFAAGPDGWRWDAARLGSVLVAAVVVTIGAGGSLGDIISALVDGPRRLLSTEWPSPAVPTLIGTVGWLLALMVAAAASLARRRSARWAPLVPLAAGLIALRALGAPLTVPGWTLAVIGMAALALAILTHGDSAGNRIAAFAADWPAAAAIAVVTVAAVGLWSVLGWVDRADPRRVHAADQSRALIDPIEAMAALRLMEPPLPLFDVEMGPGSVPPRRWRIASLATYDGQRWVPEITLHPIGRRLALSDGRGTVDAVLTIRSTSFELLPSPGRPLVVEHQVETDAARTVMRLVPEPRIGERIAITANVSPAVQDAVAAAPASRPVDEVAGRFSEVAGRLAEVDTTPTALGQIRAIESALRDEWLLDSDTPGGGQQLALLERFVNESHRGTREQFVSAFVLMVRSLGFDGRVAAGFEVAIVGDRFTIDSSSANVWAEVRFEGIGWVAFDPVPEEEATDDEIPPAPPAAQSPAAAQPPIAPPVDEKDAGDEESTGPEVGEDAWGRVLGAIRRVGVLAGLGVLPFVVLIGSILGLKWWRRRRRRSADRADRVIRGVWVNVTDSLVDAGLTIEPAWTDHRIAVDGSALAPQSRHELRRLAALAAAMTFGPTDGAATSVADATAMADAITDDLDAGVGRWRRLRRQLSLRSLRASTRSPVRW